MKNRRDKNQEEKPQEKKPEKHEKKQGILRRNTIMLGIFAILSATIYLISIIFSFNVTIIFITLFSSIIFTILLGTNIIRQDINKLLLRLQEPEQEETIHYQLVPFILQPTIKTEPIPEKPKIQWNRKQEPTKTTPTKNPIIETKPTQTLPSKKERTPEEIASMERLHRLLDKTTKEDMI